MSKRRFSYGQATDKGRIHESNQDAALSLVFSGAAGFANEDIGLFMVAHGMGGKDGGEMQSGLAVSSITQSIVSNLYLPQPDYNMMNSVFEYAQKTVQEQNSAGIFSVIVACLISDIVLIGNQGNNHAHFVFEGGMERINRLDLEHINLLIEKGEINPSKISKGMTLINVRPRSEDVTWDTYTRRMKDPLLLCSNSLYDHLSEEQFKEIVLAYPDPQEACEQLIATAKTTDSTDNMTAIVVRMNH